jgi:hypothetical protein
MSTQTDLYNQDFYTWALTTAELMRQKQWHEICCGLIKVDTEISVVRWRRGGVD